MKNMYGKVTLNISTVRLNFAGSEAKPGALRYISQGAPKIPSIVTRIKKMPSNVATLFINTAVSLVDLLDLYSAKIGTKACVNAPSAEILLSKLGILNATKNASVTIPAPKIRAIMLSRKNPNILETVVIPPTPANAFERFIMGVSLYNSCSSYYSFN